MLLANTIKRDTCIHTYIHKCTPQNDKAESSIQLSDRPGTYESYSIHSMYVQNMKQSKTTHLDLGGTGGLGHGCLGRSGLLGLDRSAPASAATLQGGHDGGGDRKGEVNDGQGELHDSKSRTIEDDGWITVYV